MGAGGLAQGNHAKRGLPEQRPSLSGTLNAICIFRAPGRAQLPDAVAAGADELALALPVRTERQQIGWAAAARPDELTGCRTSGQGVSVGILARCQSRGFALGGANGDRAASLYAGSERTRGVDAENRRVEDFQTA